MYDAEELASSLDSIIVTINYRLGIFGFFANTLNSISTPNHGLADIRTAYAWIQNNIGRFGGQPDKISLLGQSAGALAVAYLIGAGNKNPIPVRSASMLSIPAMPFRSIEMAMNDSQDLLKELGCHDLTCARGKSVNELLDAQGRVFSAREGRSLWSAFPPIGMDNVLGYYQERNDSFCHSSRR